MEIALANLNDGRYPGGPTTVDVQRDRLNHRWNDIWNGQVDYPELRGRFHGRSFQDWQLNQNQLDLVAQAGFGHFHKIRWLKSDLSLCYALAERFWPKTQTFHIGCGEMSITLEDTLHCTGLSITGLPVCIPYAAGDFSSVIQDLLGIDPENAKAAKGSIRLEWLRDKFGKLPPNPSQYQVECYTRAYLLALCGGMCFPNAGNLVNASLLKFFENFIVAGTYAWGAAVLAYLYRSLGNFAVNEKISRKKSLMGCMFLLQVWAHEHFPIGRPVPHENAPSFPRALRWTKGNRTYNGDPHNSLSLYRQEFDLIPPSKIIWTPYHPLPDDALPMLTTARDLSLHCACLIYMHIVENHPADRCLRQFGMHQTIPLDHVSSKRRSRRASGIPGDDVQKWNNRFEEARVEGDLCLNINAMWPSHEFQIWYGRPQIYNPNMQFQEPRYVPKRYMEELYLHFRTRCEEEAANLSDVIRQYELPVSVSDDIAATIKRLRASPPQWGHDMQEVEHSINVPVLQFPRRRRQEEGSQEDVEPIDLYLGEDVSEVNGLHDDEISKDVLELCNVDDAPDQLIDIVVDEGEAECMSSCMSTFQEGPSSGLDIHLSKSSIISIITTSPVNVGLQTPFQIPISWPLDGKLSVDWIQNIVSAFDWSSRNFTPSDFPNVLPVSVFNNIFHSASKLFRKEPNIVKIDDCGEKSSVVVVGDVHGQLHDVVLLLQKAGFPSEDRFFVFNGDYVDRGAWGLETFMLLLAWKVFMPHRVFLLRGNHESKFCTTTYGFEQEVMAKYGAQGKHVYRKFLGCFKDLPLASIIAGRVYTTHGGLFRSIPVRPSKRLKGGNGEKIVVEPETNVISLGSLDELSQAKRSVVDPPWEGANLIPGDVLWSDPSIEPGLSRNLERGMGLYWGPDVTEAFLKKNALKLIIRSHEGPDAREKRDGLGGMQEGYTIDHDVKSGKLITIFSAPDYPQYQATEERFNNKGAYVVLEPPHFDVPIFHTFEAITPRPKVNAYYNYEEVLDTDVEPDCEATSKDLEGHDKSSAMDIVEAETHANIKEAETQANVKEAVTQANAKEAETQANNKEASAEVIAKEAKIQANVKEAETQDIDKKLELQAVVIESKTQAIAKEPETQAFAKESEMQANGKEAEKQAIAEEAKPQANTKEAETQVNGKEAETQADGEEAEMQANGKEVETRANAKGADTQTIVIEAEKLANVKEAKKQANVKETERRAADLVPTVD
ncbi:hypothetical protein GIB67_023932 [Kingdonia uniflora]|uniref:Serine/threonine-protein phosphatase n=1 Tax=Kingdonia uniflora TaxID=39325 RepID=A0A7J7M6D3_9MAGN|nr:hypothetical protein GIB67_023932 [Kingdonia uniflora]